MSTAVAFHAQLASIMEVLANAAVAEICELVDNGYAVLQVEISRGQKENDSLKRRLRLMELKAARSASALRFTGMGGSVFASGRARALSAHHHQNNELKRNWKITAEAQLLRVSTTQVPDRCEDAGLSGDTGQDSVATQRKPIAAEVVKPKSPVIKEEKVDELWANTEPDEVFHHVIDEDTRESLVDTEAIASVAKHEVGEQDDSRSCTWVSGDIPNTGLAAIPKNLTASKISENSPGLPEPVGYDCMMYEPQIQHEPPTDDPGCSYSLNTSVSISAPSDPGNSFPFVLSEVAHSVAEHQQQAAAFTDNRQRAPLSADDTQMAASKDIQAVPSAFVMREDWASQDGYSSGSNFTREEGGKSFICSFCGKTLACLKNLKTHMRVHTGEKPFSCPLCGKRFSDSSNLKRHQSVHTGEKRYGCVHCGKRFAQSGSLKVHMSVHSGCKQFKCPICGKTFISSLHLRRHITIHDGEKRLSATFQ